MSNISKPIKKKNDDRNSVKAIMWATFIAFILICFTSIAGIVLINVFNVPISKLNHFDTKIDSVDTKVDLVKSKIDLIDSSVDVSSKEVNVINEGIRTVDSTIDEINSRIEEIYLNDGELESGSDLDKGIESTLLATGLAIIGIAIAVWAGLNIINAIDRNELNSFIKTSEEKNKYLNKKLRKNAKIFHKELKENAREIKDELKNTESSFIKAMNVNFKNAFIKELKNVDNDILTIRLHEEFIDNIDNISFNNWELLLEIEQLFCQVYDLHGSAYKADWRLIEKSDTGIEKSKKLLKSANDVLIKKYLNSRIAEFNFYKGYCQKGQSKVDSYYAAATLLSEYFKEIIPYFKQEDFLTKSCNDEFDKELCCYICNTIGEAYSKIIEQPKEIKGCFIGKNLIDDILEDIAEKAIYYCKIPIELLDHKKINEVYFRNYGCALERKDKVLNKNKEFNENVFNAYHNAIIAAFDERISIPNKRWYNVYYVNASYLHKIFKEIFGFNSVDEYDKLVSDTSKFNEKNIELIDKMLQITEMALQSYPNAKAYISLSGFACCYKMIVLLAKKDLLDKEKEEIYEKYLIVSKQIKKLDFMGICDPYSKELRGRKIILDEIIKSKGIKFL